MSQPKPAIIPSHVGILVNRELEAAKQILESLPPSVSIYGGSRVPEDDTYYLQTVELARAISHAGIPVISGGGPGIMEAANKGAREGRNGLSIGLNIVLPHEQVPNAHQDISIQFETFAARKISFCKYSMAFVVMPGGVGTLDEAFEVLTLIQCGKMPEIPVLLYGSEFWGGLVTWLKTTVLARGLISAVDIDRRLKVVDTCQEVMDVVLALHPLTAVKQTKQLEAA
jgi:uncharacterized protein (TIGR00730 family)